VLYIKQSCKALIYFGLLLALLCANVVALAQPKSTLTPNDTVGLRKVIRASMAPNGKHIAYTLSYPRDPLYENAGSNWLELHIVSKDGTIRPFVIDNTIVVSPKWSPDSRLIWFISKKVGDKFSALYAIPEAGGQAQKALRFENDILGFDISEDSKYVMFWAQKAEDTATKSLRKRGFIAEVFEESTPKNQLWIVDTTKRKAEPRLLYGAEHVVSAQFIPNKGDVLIQSAPSANVNDIVTKKSLQRINLDGEVIVRYEHVGKMGQAAVSPNGQYIAFVGSNDIHAPAEGRLMLAKSNRPEVSLHLTDFEGEVTDITWLSNTTMGFIAHVGTKSIFGSKKASPSGPDYRKVIRNGGILTQVSTDASRKNHAFISHKPNHPPEVYWYSNRQLVRTSNSNPWLKDKQLAKQKRLEYKARDGQTIQGIYVEPLTPKPPEGYPLLLFVHGGPEAHASNGWLDRYSSPVHYAAANGYASFFPNYRGSTGRGDQFTRLGQEDYAGAEFNDLVDAVEYLKEENLIDSTRVGISGSSYGGYASAWGATALSKHFAAATMLAGISDQTSKFGTTDIPNEMVNGHSFIWPWEDWQFMLERSPIFHVKKHQTPLLIAHGLDDTRVHPSQSRILYRYLKELNQAPVRLVRYPKEGHGLTRAAAQLDYSKRLMRWMDYYLLQNKEELPPLSIEAGTKP
jgi:dipeptidyl aminopeptidase/acylaminoacyl peptidase